MLGAVLQATPYSNVHKKVVELPGGEQATTSNYISNVGGWNVLDNNQVWSLFRYISKQVNFAMTFIITIVSMGLFAWLSQM